MVLEILKIMESCRRRRRRPGVKEKWRELLLTALGVAACLAAIWLAARAEDPMWWR